MSTHSAAAQRWFDQGLQLVYGFNHDEALRSFREAARQDPACAMAWWGVAYANGIHVNRGEMTAAASAEAYKAAQEAQSLAGGATPAEQALIAAVTRRYAWPVPENRKPLDEAYAAGMELHPGRERGPHAHKRAKTGEQPLAVTGLQKP